MLNAINHQVKKYLAKIGLEIRRNPYANAFELQKALVTEIAPVIFDVGAFRGETYLEYRRIYPKAKLHLVEPFQESIDKLKVLTEQDKDCRIHEVALADESSTRKLFFNAAPATNSLKKLHPDAGSIWENENLKNVSAVNIETKTLDDLTNSINIDQIDILKIDVQGAEFSVLLGGKYLLSNQKIGVIFFEHIVADTYEDQKPLQAYLELMTSYNYTLLDVIEPVRRNARILQFDLIFASKNIVAQLASSQP